MHQNVILFPTYVHVGKRKKICGEWAYGIMQLKCKLRYMAHIQRQRVGDEKSRPVYFYEWVYRSGNVCDRELLTGRPGKCV